MGKLIVLSEIDCSSFLNSRKIYPNEFYTDFMLFKNKAVSFVDCDVIILFAGSCHFSKRHVLDVVRTLQKRAEDKKDLGVNSVTVFTDVYLPSIKKYYKFQGKLSNISEYSGWKLKVKDSTIWEEISRGYPLDESKYFMTNFDKGDVSSLKEEYRNLDSPEEPLRELIKKPNFTRISEI